MAVNTEEVDRIKEELEVSDPSIEDGMQIDYTNYNNPRLTIKQVADALVKSGGRVMEAAKLLKCNFKTIYKYIDKDQRLQILKQDLEELHLDAAESSLMSQIKRGNLTAIIFFLKCKGKRRGWIEDERNVTHINKPVVFNYKLVSTNGTTIINAPKEDFGQLIPKEDNKFLEE